MSASTKLIKRDASNTAAIPQYFNDTANDFEPLKGKNGGSDVNVLESILPTGAATDAKLDSIITALGTLQAEVTAIKSTDGVKKITDTVTTSTTLTGSMVALNEPSSFISVAAGAVLEVSIDTDNIKDYFVLVSFLGGNITWDLKARMATSTGIAITSSLDDTLITSAVQGVKKTETPVNVKSSTTLLRFTNGDASAKDVKLYVYGRRV